MTHTHWLALSENTQNEERLQAEEDKQEHQRRKLVKGVECVGPIVAVKCVVPVASPAESSVESNVTRANEHDDSRDQEQTDRNGGTIIKKLVANQTVEHKDPSRRNNGGNMNANKCLQCG